MQPHEQSWKPVFWLFAGLVAIVSAASGGGIAFVIGEMIVVLGVGVTVGVCYSLFKLISTRSWNAWNFAVVTLSSAIFAFGIVTAGHSIQESKRQEGWRPSSEPANRLRNELVDFYRRQTNDPRSDDEITLLYATSYSLEELVKYPGFMADYARIQREGLKK